LNKIKIYTVEVGYVQNDMTGNMCKIFGRDNTVEEMGESAVVIS